MKTIIILSFVITASSSFNVQYGHPTFEYSPTESRVVGGKEAQTHAAPYIVSLQVMRRHFCGGSIIGAKYVVTAAHCMVYPPALVSAVAGLHDVKGTEGSQSRSVSKMIKHEKYVRSVGPYDIGILILRQDLEFNDKIQSIALPQADAVPAGEGTLYGWGSVSTTESPVLPRFLMTVTKPIIEYSKCETTLGGPGATPLHETNICTGPLTGGVSACSGDSGGPFVQANDDGAFELVGIVSWGYIPCGSSDKPSVYTRVSAYVDWINSKT